MHKHLWLSPIASLFVQCAIGQTDDSRRVTKRLWKKISAT